MNWRHLEVKRVDGRRRRQRRANPQRGNLVALPAKPVQEETVFVADVPIHFPYAVIAVTNCRHRCKIIAQRGRRVGDATGFAALWPVAIRPD